MMNRLANAKNPFQGTYKRVLCLCSAGLLRSPTAAWVLANEFECNTRCAGLEDEFALIRVDRVLLEWADEVVVMNEHQEKQVKNKLKTNRGVRVINLDISDSYEYRDPELVRLIRDAYKRANETEKD